jgi:hypothetical protein
MSDKVLDAELLAGRQGEAVSRAENVPAKA